MITPAKQRKNIKISFNDFRILKLSFETAAMVNESSETVNPGFNLAYYYNEDSKRLDIILRVSLPEKQKPYSFEVVAGGQFTFNEEPDKKAIETFAGINCPAIMFPYIRETIADLTRRAGFTPLHLTPVNFVTLGLQLEKIEPEVEKAKKSKRK